MDEGVATAAGTDITAEVEKHFPALYHSTDVAAAAGQRTYLNITRQQLAALVTGAAFGAISWHIGHVDVSGILAALAFGLTLILEGYLLREQPSRRWYGGRSVAESAKTLSWRFVVGGAPFPATDSDHDASRALLGRLGELIGGVPGEWLATHRNQGQATIRMREIRALPLSARRELYRAQRIENQIDWYATKAQWNEQRAKRWAAVFTALTVAGLAAAICRAAGLYSVDVLGVIAAVLAATGSWTQLKQHQTLISAYTVTQLELSLILDSMPSGDSEEEWAAYVGSAEEAISREHTMWRATR
jgi:hypothetical protein